MDSDLRQNMLRYYDERASEYEEAYVLGTGTASIPDPEVFRREASILTRMVEHFARGRLVDLACGTGYWLPYYIAGCSSITLIDQAPRMLQECRKKIASRANAHDALDRITIVQDDVLEHSFRPRAFDSALIGFLISHLADEEEQQLFERLKTILDVDGRFLILDSAWSPERARVNRKTERQERRLNDGSRFEIYKRYIDRQDIHQWATKYGIAATIEHFGTAFVAVSGRFQG
jgi:SAM-dependent methyltransferase